MGRVATRRNVESFAAAMKRYIRSGYAAPQAMKAVWHDVKIGRVERPPRRHFGVRGISSPTRRTIRKLKKEKKWEQAITGIGGSAREREAFLRGMRGGVTGTRENRRRKNSSWAEEEAQRQRARLERGSRRGDYRSGSLYEYQPGLMDRTDPRVIRGRPIQPGAVVSILRDRVDPLGKIVWIVDQAGNEQSVWRAALKRVGRRPAGNPLRTSSLIHFIVDKMHVGTSDEAVIDEIKRRATKATSDAALRQYVKIALRRHHANQDLYRRVQGGWNPRGRRRRGASRAKFCVQRLEAPSRFDKRSFRTVRRKGHVITIGCPKGKWTGRRCSVGTRAQRILHPAGEGKCPIGGRELRNPTYGVYWSPEGKKIATVQARTERAARRKAPRPYRKYLGEVYAVKENAGRRAGCALHNPRVKIYGRVHHIVASDRYGAKSRRAVYKHDFNSPATIYGLPNGDLYIHGTKRLWLEER